MYAGGSVVSPLLWNLVVDTLLLEVSVKGFYIVEYVEDTVILTNGELPQTVTCITNSPRHNPAVL
jgi:hypothetical protein